MTSRKSILLLVKFPKTSGKRKLGVFVGRGNSLPTIFFMGRSIVLDLDGVISNIALAIDDWLFHNQGIDPNNCDYSSWLITDSKDDRAMNIFNNPLFWKNMRPYDDAWYCTNEWFSKGDDVYIVTARRCPAAIEQTESWLDMWKIATMPPIFTNIHEKHSVIKDINPEFVVEDNPNEVRILQEQGIKTFLRKQWYNKHSWDEFPTINCLWDIERKD